MSTSTGHDDMQETKVVPGQLLWWSRAPPTDTSFFQSDTIPAANHFLSLPGVHNADQSATMRAPASTMALPVSAHVLSASAHQALQHEADVGTVDVVAPANVVGTTAVPRPFRRASAITIEKETRPRGTSAVTPTARSASILPGRLGAFANSGLWHRHFWTKSGQPKPMRWFLQLLCRETVHKTTKQNTKLWKLSKKGSVFAALLQTSLLTSTSPLLVSAPTTATVPRAMTTVPTAYATLTAAFPTTVNLFASGLDHRASDTGGERLGNHTDTWVGAAPPAVTALHHHDQAPRMTVNGTTSGEFHVALRGGAENTKVALRRAITPVPPQPVISWAGTHSRAVSHDAHHVVTPPGKQRTQLSPVLSSSDSRSLSVSPEEHRPVAPPPPPVSKASISSRASTAINTWSAPAQNRKSTTQRLMVSTNVTDV